MTKRPCLVAMLAALIPIASGCNAILGIERHSLATGLDGGDAVGPSGSDRGLVDAAKDGAGVDAAAGSGCGFIMPNPAGAGLPNPASYTRVSDGVADNVTKLIWESRLEGSSFDQFEAVRACMRKGAGWRLPTRIELASLVDFTIREPGPTINAIFEDRPALRFWTSSHSPVDDKIGWYVDFRAGITRQIGTSNPYRVRCVRSAPSPCSPTRYQVQADLVRDEHTGLTWRGKFSETKLAWMDAMKYCPTLGAGWRVPSLPELQTIVDETKEEPSIDLDVFPDTPRTQADEYFWTSSAQASDPNFAWYVIFFHGHADTQPIRNTYFVRCVR